jgi:signal peptidase II
MNPPAQPLDLPAEDASLDNPPTNLGSRSAVPARRYVLFAVIAGAGLAADLLSKSAVFARCGYPAGRSAWQGEGPLRFRYFTSFNSGALWGLAPGLSWVFASLSALAVAFILYWLFVRQAARSLWLTLALALILAGTAGNLHDRLGLHGCRDERTGLVRHAVRDFVHVRLGGRDWPVFNLADVCLVAGAAMIVLPSVAAEFRPRTPSAECE